MTSFNKDRTRQSLLGALMLFFLSACQGVLNFSPESAAVSEALRQHEHSSILVDPETVQVTQTQALGDKVFVQVASRATHGESPPREGRCLFVYETQKTPIGYSAGSGGGGCSSGDTEAEPFEVGMGNNRSQDGSFSYVYGYVNDPEIATMDIVWEDEQANQVDVTNGTYLFTREGNHGGVVITGLDEQGEAVHVWDRPDPEAKE